VPEIVVVPANHSEHDNVTEDLSISGAERLLAEMGYQLAGLVDVPAPHNPGKDRGTGAA
jgi:hypothetical protein